MTKEDRKFDIEKVASIARLELAEGEMRKMEKDIQSIIEAFSELDNVNADCEPSFQPIAIKNVTRQDAVEKSLEQEAALSLTEHKERGFFKGPRIL